MIGLFSDAPGAANLNLAAQILMGAALIAGMFLARARRFRAHGICQSAVVLLNLIPITLYMVPVFHRAVFPKIPAMLGEAFYALPAAHAVLGTLAELLGLYIIVRAGTNLLPAALCFKNYKLWMRSELVLWWLVISLGLGTYWVWYKASGTAASPVTVSRAAASPAAGQEAGEAERAPRPPAKVVMSNFAFEPKELTIEPGTTVIWRDMTGRHSVKADDGSFESEVLAAGGEFQQRFEREGRYPFYCTLHGSPGGHDMSGIVIVKAPARP